MPAGPRLLSYKGRIAGLFFSSAARRQKRRKGSGGLSTASLSTSTMKSDARHERMLCSCKLRLRRASPTVGLPSGDRALLGLRRLHAGGAKTCSYKLILCLRLLLARSGNGKSQSSSDPIACDEDALSGIDPRRGVRDLQRKKRLVGRGAAVSSGSQHGDGLEELEPTDRDDATAATRRRFGLATIVPLDAG